MEMLSLVNELKENAYPGRGIVLGKSEDGKKAVAAYFIMGRSENSRNRVFVEEGQGIRTQAFDPSKLVDPSLIIYAPVPVSYTHLDVYKRQIQSAKLHMPVSSPGKALHMRNHPLPSHITCLLYTSRCV